MTKQDKIDLISGRRKDLQAQGFASLGLFGSIERGDDTQGSDVDVLEETSD
ncbi:MAG: nucleotidyltransferase domain-containing protein [Desulfomonile sp.]|nr:nucleotidyltransferase domain-containing protein [Desulfomonile sp.]